MKITNPRTHKVIKELPEDSVELIEAKFHRALHAHMTWAERDLKSRIDIIQIFLVLLEENSDHLAKVLSSEVGKPMEESLNEIKGAQARIKFFVENSEKWLSPKRMNQEGNTTDELSFDSLGVVCNISAWNYPYLVGVNVFIPALIAGNSVLYKPSEYATLTGLEIEKLLHEAGVPQDNFIAVIGSALAGKKLLDLPCDGYFFTGSYRTGKGIAERASSKLVPVGLELGGKDPLYVTDDISDLEKVAAAVVEGVFYNNGQSCCSVERVYVHEKHYDPFLEAFLNEVKKLKAGAVTQESHLNFLEAQVQDAVSKGAQILLGGKRAGEGNFFGPTVLTQVDHQMSLMKEETFGPLIGIMKVSSDEEAIRLMNDTEYGLTASVYCDNQDRAKKILKYVDTGTAYINCCDRVSPYLPWSGRKNSGLGSTLSYLGILTFTKPRGWHLRT